MNEQNPVPKPKIIDLAKGMFAKFKANKKLFIPTIAVLVLIFVTIIAGGIFSMFKNKTMPKEILVPTPNTTIVPNSREVGGNETKLKNLKQKILNLDIYQKRLSPPTLDFKVDF